MRGINPRNSVVTFGHIPQSKAGDALETGIRGKGISHNNGPSQCYWSNLKNDQALGKSGVFAPSLQASYKRLEAIYARRDRRIGTACQKPQLFSYGEIRINEGGDSSESSRVASKADKRGKYIHKGY